jgi:hypothetical protein
MGWIKLDENFYLNRKAIAAGRDGRDLFVAALCWSNQQRTDGVIPAATLSVIGGLAGVPDVDRAATTLVDVGMWLNHVDGWQIHDFLKYQQSREDREDWLERDRERKRAARAEKAARALEAAAPMAPRTPKGVDVPETVQADSTRTAAGFRSRDVDVDVDGTSSSSSARRSLGAASTSDDDGRAEEALNRYAERIAATNSRSNKAGFIRAVVAKGMTDGKYASLRSLAALYPKRDATWLADELARIPHPTDRCGTCGRLGHSDDIECPYEFQDRQEQAWADR